MPVNSPHPPNDHPPPRSARPKGRRLSNRRILAPVDWDEAVRLYLEELRSIASLARQWKTSFNRMRNGLVKKGVRIRKNDPPRDEKAIALYAVWHRAKRAGEFAKAFKGFAVFRSWALEHGYERGKVLVAHDTSQALTEANARFVSRKDAAKLREIRYPKKGRTAVTAFQETKSLAEWSRDPRCKVSKQLLRSRLLAGYLPEEAITKPPGAVKRGADALTAGRSKVNATESVAAAPKRIDWDRAKAMYRRGVALPEILRAIGCSRSGFHNAMRRLGVPVRWRVGRTSTLAGRRLHEMWDDLRKKCEIAAHAEKPTREQRTLSMARAWKVFARFHRWAMGRGYEPGMVLVRNDARKPYSQWNCDLLSWEEARERRAGRTRT